MVFSKIFSRRWLLLLVVVILFVGCGKKKEAPMMHGFAVNVVAAEAKVQPMAEQISLVGTMEANESIEIKSEIDGAVEMINFEEGVFVKKDTILYQINKTKLEASLAQAQANLDLAKATGDRYKTLIASGAVAQQEYDQAVATLESNQATLAVVQEELAEATIVAPFDGIMGKRLVSIGQFVTKGDSLGFLINQDPMKAQFHMPERYLSRIQSDQKIQMTVAAYPDNNFEGTVYFIDPQIEAVTRTALIKAYVNNKEGKLRQGMFAKLDLIFDIREEAITIPETAIITTGDQTSVFVIKEDKSVTQRNVEVGIRRQGMVEIVSGIAAGEVVVVEGYQKLGEGAKVNAKMQEGAPAAATTDKQDVSLSDLLQKHRS